MFGRWAPPPQHLLRRPAAHMCTSPPPPCTGCPSHPAGPMCFHPNPFGRLLNAFFAANLVEEINRFVFIILGIAGAALISGGAGGRGLGTAGHGGQSGAGSMRHRSFQAVDPTPSALLLYPPTRRHAAVCLPHLGGRSAGQPRAPPLPRLPAVPSEDDCGRLMPGSHVPT